MGGLERGRGTPIFLGEGEGGIALCRNFLCPLYLNFLDLPLSILIILYLVFKNTLSIFSRFIGTLGNLI